MKKVLLVDDSQLSIDGLVQNIVGPMIYLRL